MNAHARYEVITDYYYKYESITVNTITWEDTGWVFENGEWRYIPAPTVEVNVVAFSSTFKDGYTLVSRGTTFQNVVSYTQPNEFQGPTQVDGKFITNPQLYNTNISDGVPSRQSFYVDTTKITLSVTIPIQPIPEQDITKYPWAYGFQEPLTNIKRVEQKNFNVDRYYLLEATDSFDGVCNLVLLINWNFNLNTLPVNQINNTQFCVFNATGTIDFHDSYIQNKPINDGLYIYEFSHFNLETPNFNKASSELIYNGKFQYNIDQDVIITAKYKAISVISGASVFSVKDFQLKVPVYENFTFK
jgi:hypothetical protein